MPAVTKLANVCLRRWHYQSVRPRFTVPSYRAVLHDVGWPVVLFLRRATGHDDIALTNTYQQTHGWHFRVATPAAFSRANTRKKYK